MPTGLSNGLNLRLNSQLYFYRTVTTGLIRVSESYAIKSGPVINGDVGSWTESTGIIAEMSDTLARRSNLQGTHIDCFIEAFAFAATMTTDGYEKLVNASGYFIVIPAEYLENIVLQGMLTPFRICSTF